MLLSGIVTLINGILVYNSEIFFFNLQTGCYHQHNAATLSNDAIFFFQDSLVIKSLMYHFIYIMTYKFSGFQTYVGRTYKVVVMMYWGMKA